MVVGQSICMCGGGPEYMHMWWWARVYVYVVVGQSMVVGHSTVVVDQSMVVGHSTVVVGQSMVVDQSVVVDQSMVVDQRLT